MLVLVVRYGVADGVRKCVIANEFHSNWRLVQSHSSTSVWAWWQWFIKKVQQLSDQCSVYNVSNNTVIKCNVQTLWKLTTLDTQSMNGITHLGIWHTNSKYSYPTLTLAPTLTITLTQTPAITPSRSCVTITPPSHQITSTTIIGVTLLSRVELDSVDIPQAHMGLKKEAQRVLGWHCTAAAFLSQPSTKAGNLECVP